MFISEIVEATQGRLLAGHETRVAGISIDSRTLRRGELYIAIRGKVHDGHQFLPQAVQRGAIGAIVDLDFWRSAAGQALVRSCGTNSRNKERAGSGLWVLVGVTDTVKALGDIAASHRRKFTPVVIGITGSNGKSTTKEMLATILEPRLRVLKPESSFNNAIGVPLTVLRLSRLTQVAIVEMEMNILGGIRRLCAIARPSIGVITNIGDTHLEFLKTRLGVAQEKSELLEYIGTDGLAVLNADDPLVMKIGQRFPTRRRVTFGVRSKADFRASDIEDRTGQGMRFLLNRRVRVTLPVLGRHNVYNALAAAAVAHELGCALPEIAERLRGFASLPLRLEQVSFGGRRWLVDCYNANPQSMAAALEVLAGCPSRRRIAVLGEMLELGRAGPAQARALGRRAGAVADIVLALGQQGQSLIRGALESGHERASLFALPGIPEAVTKLIDITRPGDTILIKGSRANQLEQIVRELKNYYDANHESRDN